MLSAMFVSIVLLASLAMQSASSNLQVVNEEVFSQLTDHPASITYVITLKAILPDGSHALLDCTDDRKTTCVEVQSLPPEQLPPKDQSCVSNSTKEMGYVNICKYKDVGDFRFKRSGDRITIYHRNGKTTFKVTSSW